jgi:hypothetical protein
LLDTRKECVIRAVEELSPELLDISSQMAEAIERIS